MKIPSDVNLKFFEVKTDGGFANAHCILNLQIALVFSDSRVVYGRAVRHVSKSKVQNREARFSESNAEVTPVSAVVCWHDLWWLHLVEWQ